MPAPEAIELEGIGKRDDLLVLKGAPFSLRPLLPEGSTEQLTAELEPAAGSPCSASLSCPLDTSKPSRAEPPPTVAYRLEDEAGTVLLAPDFKLRARSQGT